MFNFKAKIKDIVRTIDKDIVLTLTFNSNDLEFEELNLLKNYEKGVKFSIGKWSEKRSLDANAYFHLLVNKIARKINISDKECKVNLNLEYGTIAKDELGNNVVIKLPSSVDIKQYYDYAKFIGEKTENNLKLSYYVFYKQTHTLTRSEMSKLIEGVVYEAKNLGIQTETPEQISNMINLWSSYEK